MTRAASFPIVVERIWHIYKTVEEQQDAWEASQNATASLVKHLLAQGSQTRAAVFLAHIMHVLIRFRKSPPPHNRQLIVYYY